MGNKISIIVPAYNIEDFLPETLDSILAQTYRNIEVIVVNDGSRDSTGRIIDQYAARDSRIKAIHKENGGVTSARLRGVAEASGNWIGFVDGDDYVEPGMYEQLLKNALENSADISHCGYQMVFPDGHIDYYYNTGRLVQQGASTGIQDLLEGAFVEPGLCNKLFRRTLFACLQCKDAMPQDIKINEDLLMNYRLFSTAGSAVFEDVCPYHYVLRKGSAATSKLNSNKLQDPLKVLHIIQKDAPVQLQGVILARLTRLLIAGATMELQGQPELVRPHRRETLAELRLLLGQILRSDCSVKLKVMALWAAVWPAGYRWVHRVYARVTGVDKKYNI